jgi:single-strand DNA-binding protein
MINGIQTTLVGNITEPELRFTPSGSAVCTFSVAITERRFDKTKNEWTEGPTTWVRVNAWKGLAEHVAESLTKGSRVIVTGQLRNREWKPEGSEETRYSLEMTADAVGAELTWATAKVTKAARNTPPLPDDPWAQGTAAGSAPAGNGGSGYSDEPPF